MSTKNLNEVHVTLGESITFTGTKEQLKDTIMALEKYKITIKEILPHTLSFAARKVIDNQITEIRNMSKNGKFYGDKDLLKTAIDAWWFPEGPEATYDDDDIDERKKHLDAFTYQSHLTWDEEDAERTLYDYSEREYEAEVNDLLYGCLQSY